jgi:hypothetical protein
MIALLIVAITMSKVVRAIITNHRFPNSFSDLYFQLHRKGDHVPSISFVIMSLPCVFTETNEIFFFSQELKEGIPLSYTESLDLADKDINDNWDIYQERFLRGDFP